MVDLVATEPVDMINYDLFEIRNTSITSQSSTKVVGYDADEQLTYTLTGSDFGDFDANGLPHSGEISGIELDDAKHGGSVTLTGISLTVAQFLSYMNNEDNIGLNQALMAGADHLTGSSGIDALYGYGGADVLTGGAGPDELSGGAGADIYRDTAANMVGDTIDDFTAGDMINVTDASLASFHFAYRGMGMDLGGGQTLTVPAGIKGHFVTSADATAGVDLQLGAHLTDLNDFNGDGHSDILWLRDNGDISSWEISGNTSLQAQPDASYMAAPAASWQIQGTEDVSGDGLGDVVWHNNATGQVAVWDASGGAFFIESSIVSGGVDLAWSVAGFGDFNADGKDDLLWRNVDGAVSVWRSTGTGFTQNTFYDTVEAGWHIQGIGDFNGDGRSDVLWRNDTGALSVWSGTASGFTENSYYNAGTGLDWHVAAVANFNGDGKADILWRNDAGTFSVSTSTGPGFTPNAYTDGTVGNDWSIVAHHYDIV